MENNVKSVMTVREMSKKVFLGIVILLFVLALADVVISSQKRSKLWIVSYMEDNYPYLFDGSLFPTSTKVAVKAEKSSPFDSNGFIFPDSDKEYLDEDMLYELDEEDNYNFADLLGFARNEIYARHGFPFNEGGKYYKHYTKYDWYNKMKHKEVKDSDLNKYETKNVNLIVSIEKAEGFR